MIRLSAIGPAARRFLVATAAVGLAAALLAGCTSSQVQPIASRSTSGPVVTATATPTPTPTADAAPVLHPDGTAEANLPLFTRITESVWAASGATGRAFIDALVAAGFDKSAMQVTSDTTTVGNPAESIQFSVRWGDQCLVGQVGPTVGNPVTQVLPALGGGACLLGATRPIDW